MIDNVSILTSKDFLERCLLAVKLGCFPTDPVSEKELNRAMTDCVLALEKGKQLFLVL